MNDSSSTGLPTWEELFTEFSGPVYRHAYRLTGNAPDAEDLAQDVFVRVFRSITTFRAGSLGAWVHQITTNLHLDRVRHAARIRFTPIGEETMEVADPRCEPEPVYDATHFSADVQAALAQLPPDTRRALLLSEVGGYSYEQIAQQLGVKEGTVASRIHRARARLRQSLAHRAPQLVTANAQPAEHAELVSTPTQPLKLPKLTRLPNQKSWSTQLPGRCVGCLPGPQRSTRPKVRQAKPSRTPREPVRPEPGHPGKPRPSTDVPVRKASMRHRRNYLALEPQLTTGQIARVRRAAHRPAGAHLNALPANLLPAVSGRVNAPPEASRRRPAPC